MSTKRQINKQIKEHTDEITKSIQDKYTLLSRILTDTKNSSVVVVDKDGNKYNITVAELKKICDEDLKKVKAIPKSIKDITKEVNNANKNPASKKSLGGFKRPFSYGPNIAGFFTEKLFNAPELATFLDDKHMDEIEAKLPLLLQHNISNSGILSQLFYGYRKAIPGVIDTRDKCSSFIYSEFGILDYFGKELDQIVKDGRFDAFDVNRFNMQRINAVFSRATTDETDLHTKVGVSEDELNDMLDAELEFAKSIRVAINDGPKTEAT